MPILTDDRRKELELNYSILKERIADAEISAGRPPNSVRIVAVSKNFPASDVALLNELGHTVFGENRVQELVSKAVEINRLGLSINWHMIGTLQTNKVKNVTGYVSLIESADRIRVLNAIERHAKALSITQEVLIQVNVSGEATKSGFTPKEAESIVIQADRWPHVCIRGLMTMAPYEEDPEKTRPVFSALRELLESMKERTGREDLNELSMGMTNDYVEAVKEGSTIIRIGSAIFGRRAYA
ncbi:MAG: YggS family pyridoxal phosphate-dependent enzyme [Clostridiaceae bacterium]|nr:YggS family pyridoxal phosphate-dependent enzyme [Clostridiaceae bacterium]